MHMQVVERKGLWQEEALWNILSLCWLLTVCFSFWADNLISVPFPGIGELFPFRIFLPVTAVLYGIWAMKGNDHFWKASTVLEKWVYALIGIMFVYSAASLPRALDTMYTFRKLFNLCLDLCFFFLALRLCRNEKLFRYTLLVVAVNVVILSLMGIYEVFWGGIFDAYNNDWKRFEVFWHTFQAPKVSYTNQNDYCASLVMCSSVLLLSLAKTNAFTRKIPAFATVVWSGVLFFLVKACAARLNLVAIWILFAGFATYILLSNWKKIWVPILILILFFGVIFINQYRYIVPSLQRYLADVTDENVGLEEVGSEKVPLENPRKESLSEQFFEVNEETGEKELRGEGSAGVRARLLIHCLECFVESKGLGVGLGNTELLARDRQITDAGTWSIHCFIARIISDYGLFVLIPLVSIALLLLKKVLKELLLGWQQQNRHRGALAVLFLSVLCTYPFTSTASSDAQDVLSMWFFLASVVLFTNIEDKQTYLTER